MLLEYANLQKPVEADSIVWNATGPAIGPRPGVGRGKVQREWVEIQIVIQSLIPLGLVWAGAAVLRQRDQHLLPAADKVTIDDGSRCEFQPAQKHATARTRRQWAKQVRQLDYFCRGLARRLNSNRPTPKLPLEQRGY